MSGPTGVATARHTARTPEPASIGVIAENRVLGTDLDEWVVKEIIELDGERTDTEAFQANPPEVSGWIPAKEVRTDDHLLSTSVIQYNKMKRDGDEYKCVYTQVFKKKLIGQDDWDSQRLDQSGFTITHTVRWHEDRFEYFTEKVGAGVGATTAGSGVARYPAIGRMRVPGGW